MPQDYSVRSIVSQREWEGNYGKFVDYELALEGEYATVTLTQKPETDAPSEGQSIYGHIEDSQRGPKLKKDRREDASQGSSNGAQSDKPDEAYWEARNRSIVRQHSQDMALRLYELGRTEGVFGKADSADQFKERITQLATWLDDDVFKASASDSSVPF